jgi:hypothetical protein
MLRLNLNQPDGPTGIRARISSVYDRIAGGDDYQRNEKSLGQIQLCVITLSAVASGYVNAFAHRDRLGWVGASVLALLIMGFVERFYFTLRHGLLTVYKSRKQRFAAKFSYRSIQLTLILNAMIFCAWVTGIALPGFLTRFNAWALSIHFALALIGVSAVRDYDSVAENRVRELRAESVEQDLLAIRRAAAGDNPFLSLAAKVRGWLDGMNLAYALLRDNRNTLCVSTHQIEEITSDPQPLYLSGADEESSSPNNVTNIEGKRQRR